MSDYRQFLKTKLVANKPSGFDFPAEKLNPKLFPFQMAIVHWALKRGKAGRKFIGIELKASYYNLACKNLKAAENEKCTLF